VAGPDLVAVGHRLRDASGIRTVAPFGTTLHVSGDSEQAIRDALGTLDRSDLKASAIEPSLEDVFIALMQDAKDNFAADKP
jgi:ABC-2 type transport system ATP-binding protein